MKSEMTILSISIMIVYKVMLCAPKKQVTLHKIDLSEKMTCL